MRLPDSVVGLDVLLVGLDVLQRGATYLPLFGTEKFGVYCVAAEAGDAEKARNARSRTEGHAAGEDVVRNVVVEQGHHSVGVRRSFTHADVVV